uniref:Staphylococcal nuclease domain-containing protein 1 n=1 Tax=Hadrurus spadix TaxID=141984 RepID=A0A1W7R9I0_9SCOR
MSNTQHRGIVKQILSGDALIIRGQPRGGPPPEKQVNLSNIIAPKLARRANLNIEKSQDTKDEPYAWEAREFLRKKLIGKEVCFVLDYKVPSTAREYGIIYLGKDPSGENINEAIVAEGLAEVRQTGAKPNDVLQKLIELQESAKSAKKGKWAGEDQEHIRDVKWTVENPRNFVDSLHQRPVKAIIEHVRDGSTLRAVLLPDFYYITIMLSGIRCPTFKQGEDNQSSTTDPLALEAKFFTESRLLHRDVEIILESISNQNFLGTVLHPNGNIAELLLKEGMARCVDWSITFVSTGAEKLRSAEKIAKEKRLRLWKDYMPSGPTVSAEDREFQGKVIEVINADALVIKLGDGTSKKIFLASIRPPRLSEDKSENKSRTFRPLYDIPYMYEAREFLRKKLIGKKVNVTVDYIMKKPPNEKLPSSVSPNGLSDKICCTVTIGGINVAEALVGKGLATVVRYRQDDDQRSAHYDDLLAAEGKAQKSAKGLHIKKEQPPHRVVDLCGDLSKSKQFFPFLQRAGRTDAIVEYVASGSRLRLYVPRENCLITLLLAGINCPRAARPGTAGTTIDAEPWGEEALRYTKELCLQHEVSIEVEAMDKAGNFIGWLWIDGINLSVALVQEGLATVHFTADHSAHARALQVAQDMAKQRKDNLWSSYEEPKEHEIIDDNDERKIAYKRVVITEVNPDLTFYAQKVEDGKQLEEILEKLRQEMANNPPLPGAYVARKGDFCAANYIDGQWYRAKVEKVIGNAVHLSYIDYGNKEVTDSSKLATLPSTFQSFPHAATHYGLACIKLPKDAEVLYDAREALMEDTQNNKELLLNVEYRNSGLEYVTLLSAEDKEDIVKSLIAEGLLLVDERREKRLQKIISEYKAEEQIARSNRRNIWRYGDFDDDDAAEFGYKA